MLRTIYNRTRRPALFRAGFKQSFSASNLPAMRSPAAFQCPEPRLLPKTIQKNVVVSGTS